MLVRGMTRRGIPKITDSSREPLASRQIQFTPQEEKDPKETKLPLFIPPKPAHY